MPPKKSRSRSSSRGRANQVDSADSKSPKKSRTKSKSPARSKSKSPARKSSNTKAEAKTSTPKPSTTRVSRRVTETKTEASADGKVVQRKTTTRTTSTTRVSGGQDGGGYFLVSGNAFEELLISVIMTAIAVWTILSTYDKDWRFLKLPRLPKDWRLFFEPRIFKSVWGAIFGGMTLFILFEFVIAALPFGRKPRKAGVRKQHTHGVLMFLATLLGIGVDSYLRWPVVFMRAHILQCMVMGILTALLTNFIMFIRARFFRKDRWIKGENGSFFRGFVMGLEDDPTAFGMSVAVFLFSLSMTAAMGTANLYLAGDYLVHKEKVNKALALVAASQTLYYFSFLAHQEIMGTSAGAQELRRVGMMTTLMSFVFLPFFYTTQIRFLADMRPNVPWWQLAIAAVLQLAGGYLMHQSNLQKHKFRTNPYDPDLAHLDSIPTPNGKRLLASGFWGLCRHPNYLGDLMQAIAWSIPCGFTHFWPWTYPVFLVLFFLGEMSKDHTKCEKKHGYAYKQYCERVKYKLIPFIY